jgi:uncharacterized membrane protein
MNLNKPLYFKLWDYVFIGVLASLSFYFLFGGMGYADPEALSLEKVFLRGISCLLVAGLFLNSKELILEVIKRKELLAFVGCELIYSLWHHNYFSFKKCFLDASMFFILFYSIPRSESYKWLRYLGMALVGFITLLALPLWSHFFSMWHLDGTYKAAYIHRNELGYFLIIASIFVSHFKLSAKIKYPLIVLYFAIILMTCSRSTILASSAVWGFFLLKEKKWKTLIITALVHVAIVISWRYNLIHHSSIEQNYNSEGRVYYTSTSERMQLLQTGLKIYRLNLVMGKGEIQRVDSTYNKQMDVNNFYLAHLMSYGLFPTIVMVWIFFIFFKKSLMKTRLALINLMVFAAFQAFFDYFQTAYFFMTVLFFYIFNYLDHEAVSYKIQSTQEK